MNCCNNKENNHENSPGHNHKKHMWMMVLCCGLPIIAIGVFAMFRIDNPAIKSFLTGSAFLLCPLMHLLMLPLMFRKDKKSQ